MKKLHRSKTNRIVFGIIGGLGEYWDVDPVFLRVLWITIVCISGFAPGMIAYVLAAMIVPEERHHISQG